MSLETRSNTDTVSSPHPTPIVVKRLMSVFTVDDKNTRELLRVVSHATWNVLDRNVVVHETVMSCTREMTN
jgi:hypothetical protein